MQEVKDEHVEESSLLTTDWTRRSFLKTSLVAAAVPALPIHASAAATPKRLPPIPSVDDWRSARIEHGVLDLYMSPTAQNEFGYAQASKSVTGLTGIAFPPYGCCGVPQMAWSPGFLLTCEMFLNGRVLMEYPGGNKMAYTWFPHEIVREAKVQGLSFRSRTFLPSRKRVVAESIVVKNLTSSTKKFTVGFDMRAAIAKRTSAWFSGEASLADNSGESDNGIRYDEENGALLFQAQHSEAACAQGIAPKPTRMEHNRMLMLEMQLAPGESREIRYVNTLGSNANEVIGLYREVQENFAKYDKENRGAFDGLLKSAFTPGNSDFSGYLPALHTGSEELWNLYMAGIRNLIFARRATPDSAYGTTYITLGGKVHPTLSFLWDTALTSLSLALLDPEALRRLVETWFVTDLHHCLATDHVTGKGVGPWYASNDMSLIRCAQNYLRVTGDFQWLDKKIDGKPAIEHLADHALYWKQLDKNGHGLGDYGTLENLLEVVSTYLHETAGMNAGNVSSMRFVADLLEHRGDSARARELRGEASELAQRINRRLYVEGKGWWKCEQPDGSFFEVRHCYDLLSVFDNMFEDLSAKQKQEMNHFFWEQLHSQYWMRALSPDDVDATWNIRPDHSWLGAYAAWPPATAKGLYKTGSPNLIAAWLKNVSKITNQGPVGQAHFTETSFPLEQGAAYKVPTDAPYLNDWCCISGGGFTDMVIDTLFGADLTLFNGIKSNPHLTDFDSNARLDGLRYQGKQYCVTTKGATAL